MVIKSQDPESSSLADNYKGLLNQHMAKPLTSEALLIWLDFWSIFEESSLPPIDSFCSHRDC